MRTIRTSTILLLLLWWAALAPAPAVALGPEQLGLIVNTADPYSVEIGAHYARRRGIPPANVVFVTLPAGRDEISREEFETAKAEADARLPVTVQALALAGRRPFGGLPVDHTAFAFGFDPPSAPGLPPRGGAPTSTREPRPVLRPGLRPPCSWSARVWRRARP